MIENILILDTETTGLNADKGDKVIELAVILYSLKHKTILQNFSTLFPCESNPVEHINGIKAEATKASIPLDFINAQVKVMAANAGALVAHNAQFDKKFLKTLSIWPDIQHMPWVCTKEDFKWPVQLYRNRLQDVCAAMGVAYADAHRALNDCKLIADCFSKVNDLSTRFEGALLHGGRNTFAGKGNQYV